MAKCELLVAELLPNRFVRRQRLVFDRESLAESPAKENLNVVELFGLKEFKDLLILMLSKLHEWRLLRFDLLNGVLRVLFLFFIILRILTYLVLIIRLFIFFRRLLRRINLRLFIDNL